MPDETSEEFISTELPLPVGHETVVIPGRTEQTEDDIEIFIPTGRDNKNRF